MHEIGVAHQLYLTLISAKLRERGSLLALFAGSSAHQNLHKRAPEKINQSQGLRLDASQYASQIADFLHDLCRKVVAERGFAGKHLNKRGPLCSDTVARCCHLKVSGRGEIASERANLQKQRKNPETGEASSSLHRRGLE
jgi:hypothetical protein